MNIGNKIKNARKLRKMTQSELAGDKITRNMISRIESGIANPSLDTLIYLSERLSLPVSYITSDEDDLFFYEKKEKIEKIYEAYQAKEFDFCIKLINSLSRVDNELAYIMATSCFEAGKKSFLRGSLISALKYFERTVEYCSRTIFDTAHIRAVTEMYRAVSQNIQSPLFEFDKEIYTDGLLDVFDYEMFKYITQDYYYDFKNEAIIKHVNAKTLIKERKYSDAVRLLNEAAEFIINGTYNSLLLFSIYSDIEQCYKELRNFEGAYKFANKKLSMLEGFKS